MNNLRVNTGKVLASSKIDTIYLRFAVSRVSAGAGVCPEDEVGAKTLANLTNFLATSVCAKSSSSDWACDGTDFVNARETRNDQKSRSRSHLRRFESPVPNASDLG